MFKAVNAHKLAGSGVFKKFLLINLAAIALRIRYYTGFLLG
jgi:hypothetical protein